MICDQCSLSVMYCGLPDAWQFLSFCSVSKTKTKTKEINSDPGSGELKCKLLRPNFVCFPVLSLYRHKAWAIAEDTGCPLYWSWSTLTFSKSKKAIPRVSFRSDQPRTPRCKWSCATKEIPADKHHTTKAMPSVGFCICPWLLKKNQAPALINHSRHRA